MIAYLHPFAHVGVRPDVQRGVYAGASISAGSALARWERTVIHLDDFDSLPAGRQSHFGHVEKEWLSRPAKSPIHDAELFNRCCVFGGMLADRDGGFPCSRNGREMGGPRAWKVSS